jgi:BA14K-like protein
MSKLGIVGAAALSLALAVATPALAAEFHGVRGGDLMDVGGFGGAQASTGSHVPSEAAAAHCAQRWAYYDRASGKYMGDDGQWRPCV